MHQAIATIKYGPDLKVCAIVDQGISDFYRSLIPKYYYPNRQKHAAHITVVRSGKEAPTKLEHWGKYEGLQIEFEYDSFIHFDGKYFWLNAYSETIGKIREELGLPKYRDDRHFGGVLRSEYHITIANVKE